MTTAQPATQTRRDLQQHVTNTIIAQLEIGITPWHQPWHAKPQQRDWHYMPPGLPRNATSGKTYRGINIVLLWMSAMTNYHQTQDWATFKQWREKKQMIRKGEKGSLIVYYDTIEKEVDGEIEKIPFLKSSYVFNRSQLQDFQASPEDKETRPMTIFDHLQLVERFIDNTNAVIENKGRKAYYRPSQDKIVLPPVKLFTGTEICTAAEGYYSTALHELTHWTGHEKRLDRRFGKKFGDHNYAVEELVAELGAAFLCAELEIGLLPKGTHASYMDNWLTVLRKDKQFIFRAASQASKAVEYLHGLQR